MTSPAQRKYQGENLASPSPRGAVDPFPAKSANVADQPQPPFIPGLELARRFYWEAVRPLIESYAPQLAHAAALIGPGSEVLGFDDVTSTDHHWGPRVMLFLDETDHARQAPPLHEWLAARLPYDFLGYPTNFSAPNRADNGVQLLTPLADGPVNHRVTIETPSAYLRSYLGIELDEPLTPADWLTLPAQKLRSLTAGAIFSDSLGARGLTALRTRLAYYPDDVWRYLLTSGWARIGQSEHLMGRAGSTGDELGAALIGARLVGDIMQLAFLMERRYAPYAKWFGTAFAQLDCAVTLKPLLNQAVAARTWQAREAALAPAYATLAAMHNELGITQPLPTQVTDFHGRGFKVMAMQGFAGALLATIQDPEMRTIATQAPIGNIDQVSDNTDLLEDVSRRTTLRGLYQTERTAENTVQAVNT